MSKLITQVSPIAVTLLAIACLSCDDYNIVEPRFYSEDEIVEFGVCEWVTIAERSDSMASTALGVSGGEPAVFAAGACWESSAERLLLVHVSMPMMGSLKVSILNSGGGLESVPFNDVVTAGLHRCSWVAGDKGVYAISVQTSYAGDVVWFEVN